jgi:hypothetical protein
MFNNIKKTITNKNMSEKAKSNIILTGTWVFASSFLLGLEAVKKYIIKQNF